MLIFRLLLLEIGKKKVKKVEKCFCLIRDILETKMVRKEIN
jgi:hypothetical protein